MVSRALYRTLIETSELAALLRESVPLYLIDSKLAGPTSLYSHYNSRIPGAKYFDIDEISDKTSSLSHMLPKEHEFIDYMKKLRIKNDDKLVVCYDSYGVFTSPRVWYTFKAFGRENVVVLNGGLPKWIKEGHAVESGTYDIYSDPDQESDLQYVYKYDQKTVKNIHQVKAISLLLGSKPPQTFAQIMDSRPAHVFAGAISSEYDSVSGNIPGSINLPFRKFLRDDGTMKSVSECKSQFENAGVSLDNSRNTIHTCQTGITSCISILAMETCGKNNNSLYDGSWTEYVIYI